MNDIEAWKRIDLTQSGSSWSFKVKAKRALWEIVCVLFWPKRFRFLSPIRIFLLRLFGAKIGKPALIMGCVRVWLPWNLKMGDASAIGEGVEIYNFGIVEIGSNTVVSQRTYLCTATHDYTCFSMPLVWRDIKIGNGSWIGAEAFVGPGVTIGDGAVVGARSVVVKNVSGMSIVAGNPARLIKEREIKPLC